VVHTLLCSPFVKKTPPAWIVLLSFVAVGACGGSTETEEASEVGAESALVRGSVKEAVGNSCTTAVVRGLSQQLVDEINCMKPGALVRIDRIPNVSLDSVVFPYLQAPAARALETAASHAPISINSALRTLPQQYLLFAWSGPRRCGIRLAAHVGHSNHEQGLAVDVADHSSSAMTNAGFHWLGPSDPVHWDYARGGGADLAGLSTKAFQRLWNRNHPEDKIAEDGNYGGGTEKRLEQSPAAGFPQGATCAAAAPPHDEDEERDGGP
jgi:hypothetical protein